MLMYGQVMKEARTSEMLGVVDDDGSLMKKLSGLVDDYQNLLTDSDIACYFNY